MILDKWASSVKVRRNTYFLVLLTLLPIFILSAVKIVNSLVYQNSDFFTFWLAGWMRWAGQDPYSMKQWVAGHQMFGAEWISNPIFPYPLPLYNLVAPLGLLPLKLAYITWIVLGLLLVASSVFILLEIWNKSTSIHFIMPLLAGAFIFRPTLVTMRDGQLGAILLIILVLSTLWMNEGKTWLAGAILALLLIKPTIGIPVILLAGLWLIRKKTYMAVLGMIVSAISFLALGIIDDPAWVVKFLTIGGQKLSYAFGNNPTLWGFAGMICNQQFSCTLIIGGILVAAIVALGIYIIIFGASITTFGWALCIIIPITLMITPYVWAYDQILLLIPITMVTLALSNRGYHYLFAALTPIVIAAVSLVLLAIAMSRGSDNWSFIVPLICLASVIWLTEGSCQSLSSINFRRAIRAFRNGVK